ncbi:MULTISPECIES: helix-turn-helix transcriptional regulator [unclassified Oceanispirochaeta]|uniref:helix-turn-helix domain-containing protein n=1 Tax=unclassified Oceanispirochaeta TaxID=2635722 RepID=UPI000E08EC3D|nr:MULTISPECIES: helix-turn-helix transcriptional regulator [unclassified Oceanispirochaeta]MBF9018820.1 helix-turn-helix transcriptional regulator [Oceanispirochaeta sp. M2]NPD75289.1 helix-turn-helix transcriptional regulator [Oceanispirochaeta sp. M1]RDG28849.1 XRE family transcriptional regulator [Oceanispirochaeta sp. M1]
MLVVEEELTGQITRSMGKAAREQLTPGEMLKFARLDAGLTQTKLATLAGVGNRSGIALMEAGTRTISDKMAERLAGYLSISSEILKTTFYPRFNEII